MTTRTKREQVEEVLAACGLREHRPGDWLGTGAYVRLDVAHASPETAWYNAVYNGAMMPREVVTYDELIRWFS